MAGAGAGPTKWLNVVLDIDETLLQFGEEVDRKTLLTKTEAAKYTIERNFMLRPGFDDFFAWLRDNCKSVSLWTLSDEEYADGVKRLIERRIPGLTITLVLADTNAKEAEEIFGGRKNLNYIWKQKDWKKTFHPGDTVLIDDLSKSTEGDNSRNGIWIPQFSPLGKSQKKADHCGHKRAGPYVDFSGDHVLSDVLDVLKGISPKGPEERPFPERVKIDGIHREDEDITHAGRRRTRRGRKGRRAVRKTKTRR